MRRKEFCVCCWHIIIDSTKNDIGGRGQFGLKSRLLRIIRITLSFVVDQIITLQNCVIMIKVRNSRKSDSSSIQKNNYYDSFCSSTDGDIILV